MSDATPTPPPAEEPSTPTPPPAAPAAGAVPPAAPAYSAAPAYAPGTPVKQGLSLTGFILGIASIVFSWALIFGLLVGIAGLILSVIARGREPQAPGWMKTLGLVLSIVGLAISVIVLILWIVALASIASYSTY